MPNIILKSCFCWFFAQNNPIVLVSKFIAFSWRFEMKKKRKTFKSNVTFKIPKAVKVHPQFEPNTKQLKGADIKERDGVPNVKNINAEKDGE